MDKKYKLIIFQKKIFYLKHEQKMSDEKDDKK